MCVVSAVYDHFRTRIPFPSYPWVAPYEPTTTVPPPPPPPYVPPLDTKQLLDDFREAIDAARTVDRLTGQPDCADPDKAKLEERVAELEKQLRHLQRHPRRRRKTTKTEDK